MKKNNKKIMSVTDFDMNADTVYFVPLGGCGVFGSNMSLYGYQGKWIMIDCGMGFADETMPGVDILLPDPTFAASLGSDLLGIIITHSHEDHIGALQHLWPRLKAPVYATKFSAERIRQDFTEMPWGGQGVQKLNEIPPRGRIELGPFTIETIRMAHSIPEARGLAISVKNVGTIFHTGDWKIDLDPVVGDVTDEDALRQLGEKGVLVVVGDSTNSTVPGMSGSEREVETNMTELFREYKGQIVVSCFSTSVARMHSIYTAAAANDRQVCLVGRSMWQVYDAATKSGYLTNLPEFMEAEEAEFLSNSKVVYICTGSQGEPRAALTRISNDDHRDVRVGEGDVVILSSRIIPGNERAVNNLKNRLLSKGVEVVTGYDAPIHVSGHPCRDELKMLYGWLKPQAVIAVHGEKLQMERHAELAMECGAKQGVVPEDGQVFAITKSGVQVIGEVKSGILAIEGNRIVAVDHEAILTRKRIMWNGSAVVTVVMDQKGGLLSVPQITALGLLDEECDIDSAHLDEAENMLAEKIRNMPKEQRLDDEEVAENVRIWARRYFNDQFDRKPQTRVHLVRI